MRLIQHMVVLDEVILLESPVVPWYRPHLMPFGWHVDCMASQLMPISTCLEKFWTNFHREALPGLVLCRQLCQIVYCTFIFPLACWKTL